LGCRNRGKCWHARIGREDTLKAAISLKN